MPKNHGDYIVMENTPVLAIDPGTTHSAVVWYEPWTKIVTCHGAEVANRDVLEILYGRDVETVDLAIEWLSSYGMPVGRETFETCLWVGRFMEAWGGRTTLIYRRDVKLYLCGSSRAKDANVAQAVRDRFPATGGGKKPVIGTKAKPGPLYGVSSHAWSALAVALTWAGGEYQEVKI